MPRYPQFYRYILHHAQIQNVRVRGGSAHGTRGTPYSSCLAILDSRLLTDYDSEISHKKALKMSADMSPG